MDRHQFVHSIAAINNLSAIAVIACVLPTYFLELRPAIYRLVLSVGIVCGLATLVVAISTTEFDLYLTVLTFSPFVFVLMLLLVNINRVNSVRFWSTVVLVCAAFDWLGLFALLLALS